MNTVTKPLQIGAPLSVRDGVMLSIQYYKCHGREVMDMIDGEFKRLCFMLKVL